MATVSSTSSCNFLNCQLKKNRAGVLMVHKFGSSLKMNSSPRLCEKLRRMPGYYSKTSPRTFLEIRKQLITQKLFRNHWRATKSLVNNMSIELHYLHCMSPGFPKVLLLLVTSKVNNFTKI